MIKGRTKEEIAFLLDYVKNNGGLNSEDFFGLMVEQRFSTRLSEIVVMGANSERGDNMMDYLECANTF